MLDIKFIRTNPQQVKDGIARKGTTPDLVDEALHLDAEYRELLRQIQSLREKRNIAAMHHSREVDQGKQIKAELRQLEPEAEKARLKLHEYLLSLEEKIYQGLQIPYRVVEMCTGDLGAMAARKFDIEAWMPGRNDYGEVTSTSNCTDYQARNLNIRFKREDGEVAYVHMLNGTAIATSRTPIAILENFQNVDGSVTIPEPLCPYMGKSEIRRR